MAILGFVFLIYNWIQFNKSSKNPSAEKSTAAISVEKEVACPTPEEMEEECLMPVIVKVKNPDPSKMEKPKEKKEMVAAAAGEVSSKMFSKTSKKQAAYKPKRFTLNHIVGNQGKINFSSNYSSAGLLLAPDFRCSQFLPLLDLQGHRFDDITYAATAGFVLRYIPSTKTTIQEILGLNFYYDYRQGSIGYYQQFSIGLEILADRWEIRANGYIPFGGKKAIEICPSSTCDRVAIHNYQAVSYGFNAEVGGYFVKTPSFLAYLAVGPYFISGRPCKPNTIGGEARLRPQYKDYIALDLSYSWDPLFQSIYQAEVILFAPLYQLGKRRPINDCARGLTLRQIYQNVERFDVMPLGRRTCRKF